MRVINCKHVHLFWWDTHWTLQVYISLKVCYRNSQTVLKIQSGCTTIGSFTLWINGLVSFCIFTLLWKIGNIEFLFSHYILIWCSSESWESFHTLNFCLPCQRFWQWKCHFHKLVLMLFHLVHLLYLKNQHTSQTPAEHFGTFALELESTGLRYDCCFDASLTVKSAGAWSLWPKHTQKWSRLLKHA